MRVHMWNSRGRKKKGCRLQEYIKIPVRRAAAGGMRMTQNTAGQARQVQRGMRGVPKSAGAQGQVVALLKVTPAPLSNHVHVNSVP